MSGDEKDKVQAPQQIKVVKRDTHAVNSARRETLLRNIEYMETQIGRLARMARDLRADALALTVD